MKHLLFSTLFITLFSCSSNSNDPQANNTKITPPQWIIGIWNSNQTNNPQNAARFCEFKTDDYCIFSSLLQICNAQNIQSALNVGALTKVDQTITDSEYKLVITISSTILTYHFKRITNNKIEYLNTNVAGSGLPNIFLTR